ncbi:AAA family ATPase [Pseudomonas sp. C1C7]|uniref:ATP-binding cassette domain-containing protein n=1 Tax=Pseudomonas sp. C1C7 TaxID=2735272 RepID=UPI0015868A62|nr:AAA family ATPase [Pseudomonas sp. C1C7]NUT78559.1 AAA family ATPase [Pseudomonas sp. C1C7]
MRRFSAKLIDFNYDEKTIFSQASMEIFEGSIAGILGPNGSGKTTFFDIACELKKTSSGRIESSFHDFTYLSQIISTPPGLRMRDIFKMIVALCSDEQMTQTRALEKLKVWCPSIINRYKEIWDKKCSLCSYGETRWFFTLSLLAISKGFIILDEPTAGVDPEFRHYIWECLHGAARDGAAILVSSHNVDEVINNCSYFYMISQQRFNRFSNGSEFMKKYGAKTLDDAFIRAVTEPAFSNA